MRHVTRGMWAALLAVVCLVTWSAAGRQNSSRGGNSSVPVDQTSIGGTAVNSEGGKPEAGVWVIAETKSPPRAVSQNRRHGRLDHVQLRPNPLAK